MLCLEIDVRWVPLGDTDLPWDKEAPTQRKRRGCRWEIGIADWRAANDKARELGRRLENSGRDQAKQEERAQAEQL